MDGPGTASLVSVCPLAALSAQDSGTIVSLQGGRGFVSRLAALGFIPGARLTVVQNYGHGPLIVLIRQTRVALGRNEANRILVQKEAQQ